MDYALNWQFCARWGPLKPFADTWLHKASPLFEAYKSHFSAFHEYIGITQVP